MAKAFYSIVLDHPAVDVWAVIRPFDHYAWAGVAGETVIEDGKEGDQVGAVRRVTTGDGIVRRQILLAHSDIERCYTYGIAEPSYLEVRNYVAMIRVTPVVASGASFVEWSATFDCAADQHDRWIAYFECDGFARWLAALRGFMDDCRLDVIRRNRHRASFETRPAGAPQDDVNL